MTSFVEETHFTETETEDEHDNKNLLNKNLAVEEEPVEDTAEPNAAHKEKNNKIGLKKELNLLTTVALVIGKIIGSGIFITPSRVLKYSGSFGLALICWSIGGLVAIGGGLSYVELGTMIRNSGGEYAYLREAYSFNKKNKFFEVFSNVLGFLFSWSYFVFICPGSNAVITLTFGRYLAQAIARGDEPPEASIKLLAAACIMFITLVNIYSLRGTSILINVTSVGKLLALCFISVLGIWQLIKGDHQRNFTAAFEDTSPCVGNIVLAIFSVLYSYEGWNGIAYTVEENKNAERNLPFGIYLGIPIVTSCYIFVNIAYFSGLSKSDLLSSPATALTFADRTIGDSGLVILPLMVALSTIGTSCIGVYVGSRILYTTARDGNFLELFATVHNRFKTPVASIICQGFLSAFYASIGTVGVLIDGMSVVAWMFYGLVFTGLLIMRFTKKHEYRPFKVWFIVPLLMILVSMFLVTVPIILVENERLYYFLAILLMLAGIPIYFVFIWGRFRPKAFSKISDKVTSIGSLLLDSSSSR